MRDLAARILHMPAQRVDQGDSDRLREIAVDLENMEGCIKFPALPGGLYAVEMTGKRRRGGSGGVVTTAEIAAVLAAYKSGMAYSAIAATCGVGRSTILVIVRKSDVPMRLAAVEARRQDDRGK